MLADIDIQSVLAVYMLKFLLIFTLMYGDVGYSLTAVDIYYRLKA